jgi:D-alanyl-D-alanine carboxypeptidase/D-alanyl-D-alanine-endopeptidase (penicillin-binding protein 4)
LLRLLAAAALPVVLVLSLAAPTAAGPHSEPSLVPVAAASPDLQRRLQSALSSGTARGLTAAVDVEGVGAVFRSGSGGQQPPASSEKLFTSFAALRLMTPNGRYVTAVRTTGSRVGSTVVGNLFLVAGGDPFLSMTALDHLAAAVSNAGITRITGRLYVDDYRYDQVHHGPGWKPEWVPEESGPLSALAVDGNTWRKDDAYLADPAAGNVARFQVLLAQHGVTVAARIGRAAVPAGATTVASQSSALMSDIVRRIDKDSDNFGAELLLKEIGFLKRHRGTTAAGAAGLHDVLLPLGVTLGTVADGSGLSSQNRQSASDELSLLGAAATSNDYPSFVASLPIACNDGTLKKRLCGTTASQVTHAKTGSLDTARVLAGWTTTADGRLARFSFLLTGFTSGASAQAALDRATVVLASASF